MAVSSRQKAGKVILPSLPTAYCLLPTVFLRVWCSEQASESWELVAKVRIFLPGPNRRQCGLQVLRAAHLPCKQEGWVQVPGIPPTYQTRASSSVEPERLSPKQEVAGLSPAWLIKNFLVGIAQLVQSAGLPCLRRGFDSRFPLTFSTKRRTRPPAAPPLRPRGATSEHTAPVRQRLRVQISSRAFQ